ncbi:hypothetical protein SAMN05877753_11912 [Bacillus oleivorans]|uniref:Uncharacterized protein n=1 Tax=Bacillus oleivorans TaxID=1448271 RepID=A0A285D9A2_9BACI|nr:hypothetical protein [Bacillus oleivorans]SNX75838.1 hypothetical protein SAMN05877753_11912 [Bacillus oleivorans]
MTISAILKWITGGLEAMVGIPLIGGILILSTLWAPLFILLGLHILTLVFSIREKQNTHGSILGIVTSCIAWIPFVGMIMHIITAIFLLTDAYKATK